MSVSNKTSSIQEALEYDVKYWALLKKYLMSISSREKATYSDFLFRYQLFNDLTMDDVCLGDYEADRSILTACIQKHYDNLRKEQSN